MTGYARNLDDGSVQVVACGTQAQVDKLVAWLKQGGLAQRARRTRAGGAAGRSRLRRVWHSLLNACLQQCCGQSGQMHFTGFGNPAILVACLAGPFGNRRYR